MNFDWIFRPLVIRSYSKESVQIYWNSQKRNLPQALVTRIGNHWQQELAVPSRFIYNGVLCRLDSYTWDDQQLQLHLGVTDYRELLYSNKYSRDIIATFGTELLANAVGISAIVVTADQKLALMKRSKTVVEYPDRLDVFGGHIEVPQPDDHFYPDPFTAIAVELKEELNVDGHHIQKHLCIGLIQNSQTFKPEITFLTQMDLTAPELSAIAQTARDHQEYNELIFRDNHGEGLKSWLLNDDPEQFAPSALGSLWIYIQFLSR